MAISLPMIVISRRPRQVGSGWEDAPSWFGGMPQLGGRPWPRGGARQTPFYFVAQIDLAEVGREIGRLGGPNPLPDGALAFFIGDDSRGQDSGIVLHVPRPELGRPTPPPADAPAVLEPGGAIFPATFDPAAPRLFPRWPVDVTALDVEPDAAPGADEDAQVTALEEAQDAAVSRHFTRREYFFTAKEAYGLVGDEARRFWWHSAHHYAACLRTALHHLPAFVEGRRRPLEAARARLAGGKGADVQKAREEVVRLEAYVAELERPAAEFERFAREVADWARGAGQWQPMPPEAVARLKETFERGRTTFGEFTRYFTPHSLDGLETETLLALATADDYAYATMPEAVRDLINRRYLLPTGGWHQMFGRGVSIQGNAEVENEGNVMLLQLLYDDMMHWAFGDMGAFQFWIPLDDLARGNWAAVRLTFECG
jgi:hypothetical protein